MAAISPTYASPGLRQGLLLEDHPGTEVTFSMETGTAIGIPPAYGGNGDFCVARITFPPVTGRASVIGWKPVSEGTADEWLVLCTKALGRALKRAGYPDDLQDLKSLVLWRQREAEISAITSGAARVQLAPAAIEKALEAGAVSKPDQDGGDDGEAPNTEADAEVVEAELMPPNNIDPETGEVAPNETQAMIAELVGGLDAKESKSFAAYCKTIKLDPSVAAKSPELLSVTQCEELMGWLQVDES